MERKLKETADGSHTFYVKELKEHYHSVHGAIQESRHVFIEAGLNDLQHQPSIQILEVGFGTGLNALLTLLSGVSVSTQINYTALEAYPLTQKEAEKLNFIDQLSIPEMRPVFQAMHTCKWEDSVLVCRNFSLNKLRMDLLEFQSPEPVYDLIYFDAFAPQIQPELWTDSVFQNLFNGMKQGGVLVTYCAKGSVKRALKAAGFSVEGIPGPPGKREMTRAVKRG
ncbi:MAG: tRNA (5-methylaminomethyl-2-thiouridine)(34)-methyltransferase MnmD [Bacteroidetes bacterium]|nr:tRNA (5-methylaminomethyl-2-thiouridine)(34)-methyltransferase MnmD [Bacteroidota bacterium]